MNWVEHVARIGERGGAYRFLVGKAEGKKHLEDAGIGGSIILRWIFRKYLDGGGIDWIDLAEDKDRWRAVVNAVMNLYVP